MSSAGSEPSPQSTAESNVVATTVATSEVLRLLAPAKINLHLRVGPPAPDGFHPLMSWMCTVALFDTLELRTDAAASPSEAGRPLHDGHVSNGPLLTMTCDDPRLPCDETNLVVRAGLKVAREIAAAAGRGATREGRGADAHLPPVSISLQKRVPFGAGLGGGSSDGARAMLGLNRLWRGGVDRGRLADLSAACGSDVPFFLFGSSSVCTGRGQFVRPTPRPALARWAVLVLPAVAMPTPAVYRRFDELRLGDEAHLADAPDWAAWAALASAELLPRLVNDLERPSFDLRPELGELRAGIESRLGRPVRMSGSGSSLFTLYDERGAAENAAARVASDFNVRAEVVEVAPAFEDDLGGDGA